MPAVHQKLCIEGKNGSIYLSLYTQESNNAVKRSNRLMALKSFENIRDGKELIEKLNGTHNEHYGSLIKKKNR